MICLPSSSLSEITPTIGKELEMPLTTNLFTAIIKIKDFHMRSEYVRFLLNHNLNVKMGPIIIFEAFALSIKRYVI